MSDGRYGRFEQSLDRYITGNWGEDAVEPENWFNDDAQEASSGSKSPNSVSETKELLERGTHKGQFMQLEDNCCKCDELVESRQCIVWGYGSHDSDILFIGQAPGQYYNEVTGLPLTGNKAGFAYLRALKEYGLDYEKVFTTNVVKCHPERNRRPNDQEVYRCHDFLMKEIEKVNPKIIVPIGGLANNQFSPGYMNRVVGKSYK